MAKTCKKSRLLAAVAFTATAFCGCSGDSGRSSDRPVIAVSVEPLQGIVSAVAGDGWDVVALSGKGSNPEMFDPTVRTVSLASRSRIIFTTGALGFESEIMDRIAGDHRVVDLSKCIATLADTHHGHHHGHEHDHDDDCGEEPEIDPHIWNSLRNAATFAHAAADELAAIDPANAGVYRHRADSVAHVYLAADSMAASRLRPSAAFMVGHPSLSYFARDYSLRQIAMGEENKELSIKAMRESIDNVVQSGASVYFAESRADSARNRSIASQTGIRIVVIEPTSPDILGNLTRAVAALAD